jgi:ubiquinone/menaquinone biosynthesis C-methylase UbiE
MGCYYNDKLSAQKLKRCYEIAPSRVKQYLEAELNHVLSHIRLGDIVLELGCGCGRILPRIARKARLAIGIDTSAASLKLARESLNDLPNCHLLNMDAVRLTFQDGIFDLVVCIQNGISSFHVDQHELLRESIRVTKTDGKVLFSSYSDKFWEHRLQWFQLQSDAGLLGRIDHEKTGNGEIVCQDGFTATTVRPDQFLALTAELAPDVRIVEVDESSIFCEIYCH